MNKISIIFLLVFFHSSVIAKSIAIIGCGYVGLTLAGILLHAGHTIACVEKDSQKVEALKNKNLSIYEPGLEDYIFAQDHEQRISFFNSSQEIKDSSIYFMCVSTPIGASGACDLSFLFDACCEFAHSIKKKKESVILCIKSTIPPGTMARVEQLFEALQVPNVELVYNPEFMREGSALRDIYANPIVLGAHSRAAADCIEQLYAPLHDEQVPRIKTTFETAEMIKYAWNSFSAIRIAYANELALVCRAVQADIKTVIEGFSLSEQLLPTSSIKPGPGFGGSCLPKDTQAFAIFWSSMAFILPWFIKQLNQMIIISSG